MGRTRGTACLGRWRHPLVRGSADPGTWPTRCRAERGPTRPGRRARGRTACSRGSRQRAPRHFRDAGTTSDGSPRTTDSGAPRTSTAVASADTLPRMNHRRLAERKRPAWRRSSITNRGAIRLLSACAAVSAGWSCRRRSRRNQTTLVVTAARPSQSRTWVQRGHSHLRGRSPCLRSGHVSVARGPDRSDPTEPFTDGCPCDART